MAYCNQCRIGSLDAQGLCVLCGAEQVAPSKSQRAARAGGTLLELLLNPLLLVLLMVGGLAIVGAEITRRGVQGPALAPPAPWRNVDNVVALSRSDPAGALLQFLWPAVVQALLFSMLIILGLILWRKLRARDVRRPVP